MRLYSHSFIAVVMASLCLVRGIPLQQPITFTPNGSGLRTDSVNSTIIKSGTMKTGKPPLLNETTAEQSYQSSWRARNDSPSQVPMQVKAAEATTVTVTTKVTATPTILPPLFSDLPVFSHTALNKQKVAANAQQTMSYLPVPLFPSTAIRPISSSTTTTISTNSSGSSTIKAATPKPTSTSKRSCFPALDFKMPGTVPDTLDGWWCNQEDEYAFLGFSYDVSACQSQTQLNREFLDARKTFNARYVRMYGACDDAGFYDRVIEAAWNAGIGVHSLIWFGFDGGDIWKTRRKALFKSLKNNARAPFVTRSVQFGSEPLFDWAIDPKELAAAIISAKSSLSKQKIPIIISDLVWAFGNRMNDGAQQVIDAADVIGLHMLPYYSQNATTGSQGWWNNMYDMNQMLSYNKSNKKIIWTQNGWPSTHYCPGQCPNSKNAVSGVKSEMSYYKTLDANCSQLKKFPKGGVGWFAHIYSDSQQPGYGIYDTNGNMKFNFAPRTSC